MNYKAFQINITASILLFRDINDNSEAIVNIYAYWIDDSDQNRINVEEIVFPEDFLAQLFISDFSKESAVKWLENNIENEK